MPYFPLPPSWSAQLTRNRHIRELEELERLAGLYWLDSVVYSTHTYTTLADTGYRDTVFLRIPVSNTGYRRSAVCYIIYEHIGGDPGRRRKHPNYLIIFLKVSFFICKVAQNVTFCPTSGWFFTFLSRKNYLHSKFWLFLCRVTFFPKMLGKF